MHPSGSWPEGFTNLNQRRLALRGVPNAKPCTGAVETENRVLQRGGAETRRRIRQSRPSSDNGPSPGTRRHRTSLLRASASPRLTQFCVFLADVRSPSSEEEPLLT